MRTKKRIYVDTTELLEDSQTLMVHNPNITFTAGMPVLVRNSTTEPYKVKLYSKYDDTSGSKWANKRPYKVHNKTETSQNFSFKYCIPVPQCVALLPVK